MFASGHRRRLPSPASHSQLGGSLGTITMADEHTTLAALKPDTENRRKHNPRNVGMIEDSLQEVGAGRSVVIDSDGTILAGNATVEAAGNVGIERVRIIETDGNEIIAVRRTNLSATQKKRLALYDNRTAELADWDIDQIALDVAAGDDLDGLFTPAELQRLLTPFPDVPVPVDSPQMQAGMVRCPECGASFEPDGKQ